MRGEALYVEVQAMWLTLEAVLKELHVSRSTFDKWRSLGRAPQLRKLPNRRILIHRDDLDAWLAALPCEGGAS